jgi:hypothetical protein
MHIWHAPLPRTRAARREIRAFASRFRADKQTNWLFAALIARFDRLGATTPADFRFG